MASAWLLTRPCAGLVGAGAYGLAALVGGTAGGAVDLVVLILLASLIYWRSRKNKVDHTNVNQEWEGSVVPAEPEPAAAAAAAA
jgi:inorganic phosphate transporter, PiT family